MAFDLAAREPGTCPNCHRPCDEHGCHEQLARPAEPTEHVFWRLCEHLSGDGPERYGVCQHPDAVRLSGVWDDEG